MNTARWRVFAILACITLAVASGGAQAPTTITISPNLNVLRDISDSIHGDAFLQRQNEAVVAVSTRNPEHIMVAANDYRTIEFPDDPGLGDTVMKMARTIAWQAERLLARVFHRREGLLEDEAVEKVESGTEAWVGVYLSNDRGKSWTNTWMPGFPQDSSLAGRATPAYGFQASSDPVLAPAPAGRFYLGAMVFNRNQITKEIGASKIVVSRFTDRNNSEVGANYHFDLMKVVDVGKAGRRILDKPAIIADVSRTSSDPDACGPVYVAYTVFDDLDDDPLERSKILVSSSTDCGVTWEAPKKINKRTRLSQGVALAIRPSDGTLFAAYRSFLDDNRIYVVSSHDSGKAFTQPASPSGTLLTFDQPTLGAPYYSFRTNAYPTIAVDGEDKVYVAWHERLLANTGNPRIMIATSTGGAKWSPKKAVEPQRLIALADDTTTSIDAGPQVMPALSFSRSRLMLLFYEARPGLDDVKWVPTQKASYITGLDVQLDVRVALIDSTGRGASARVTQYEAGPDGKALPLIATDAIGNEYRAANRPNLPMYAGGTVPFIGDYLFLTSSTPFVPITPSPAAAPPTTTASATSFPTSVSRSLSTASLLMTAVSTKKDGDKKGSDDKNKKGKDGKDDKDDETKKKKSGPFWRWATEPGDAPAVAFQAVWTDNRDVVFPLAVSPPVPAINGTWTAYAPPGTGAASCINPGSRNANVYSAEVAARLVVGAPTTFKQLDIQRAFPVYVQNRTPDARFYRLTISDAPGADGSFAQFPPDQNTLLVKVFPYSTVTQNVYVTSQAGVDASQPVRIDVVEITEAGTLLPGGDSATVVLNADVSNPPVSTLASERRTPTIFNPDDPTSTLPRVSNPQVVTPQVVTPQVVTPQVVTPQVVTPQVVTLPPSNSELGGTQVYTNVTHYTWQVSNGGTVTSAYTPLLNIANQATLQGKRTRLIIYKTYRTPTFKNTPDGCKVIEVPHDEIISIIENPQVVTPQVVTPQVVTPQVVTPQVVTAQVQNSTFSVAPSDATPRVAMAAPRRRGALAPVAFQTQGTEDGTSFTVTPAATMITLEVTDNNPPTPGDPPPASQPPPIPPEDIDAAVIAPALPVVDGVIQKVFESASTGADLVISQPPTVEPLMMAPDGRVPAGASIQFSSFTIKNIGEKPVSSAFRYGFYLSTTTQISPKTDVLLGFFTTNSPIAPNAEITVTGGPFTVPATTVPGAYSVGVFINDGDPSADQLQPVIFESLTNNFFTVPVTIAPGADLVPSQAAAAPAALFPGQSTNLSVTVSNVGQALAGPSATAFYLSTDAMLSANDTLLATAATPALASGVSVVESATVALPSTLTPGNYSIIAASDQGGVVAEFNESNNASLAPIKLVVRDTSTLSFATQPPNGVVGVPLAPPPQVRVVDSQSAPLSGAMVELRLEPSNGVLSGTTIILTDAAGIATFGNLTISPTGTYTLVASAPTLGPNTATQSAAFGVAPLNDKPLASDQSLSTDEDTPATITSSVSDAETNAANLIYAVITPPAHGTLSALAHTVTYTPNANYNGPDSFAYTVTDRGDPDGCAPGPLCAQPLTSNAATVSITVTPVNDNPVANADTAMTFEDQPIGIDVLANDNSGADPGEALALLSATPSVHGLGLLCFPVVPSETIALWTGEGNGTDVWGGNNGTLQGGVTFAAGRVGRAFSFDGSGYVSVPDQSTLSPPTDVTVAALINPTVVQPSSAPIVMKDGSYALRMDETGTKVSFQVHVGGAWQSSAPASVPLNSWTNVVGTFDGANIRLYINGSPITPFPAVSGSIASSTTPLTIGGDPGSGLFFQGLIDEIAIFGVRSSLGDIQRSSAAGVAGLCRPMANGQQTGDASGIWAGTFTSTTSTSTHTEGVGFVLRNTDPTHVSASLIPRDSSTTVDGVFLTSNADGVMTYDMTAVITEPGNCSPATFHGSFTVDTLHNTLTGILEGKNSDCLDETNTFSFRRENGSTGVIYVPDQDFNSAIPDTLHYTIGDGHGGTATAMVSVTLTAVNDPPVAVPDNKTTAEGTPLSFPASDLTANDLKGPPNESEQTLAVTSVTTTPATHGTVVLSAGTVTYTPSADYFGPASFTYQVCDDGATNGVADPECAFGTVNVHVTEVNDPLVANADFKSTAEDTPLSFLAGALTVNDSPGPANESGQLLGVTSVAATADTHGTVLLIADTVTHTPDHDYFGPASFTYEVHDNGTTNGVADPKFATGTVNVTITAVNDPPMLNALPNRTIDEGSLLTFTASAADIDSAVLTFNLVDPSQGAMMDAITGVFTWTPTEAQGPGTYTMTVRATDDGTPPLFDQKSFTVTVNEVNVAPTLIGVPATATTDELTELKFDVDATDPDIPAQTLAFSLVGAPPPASIHPTTGLFTWTPTEEQGPGIFTFSMQVTDGIVPTATPIAVTVHEVNVAPIASDDGIYMAVEGVMLTVAAPGVLANDTDADVPHQTLSASVVAGPAHGALTLHADGSFEYTAAAFSGTDSFTYQVSDSVATSQAAAVTIDVAQALGVKTLSLPDGTRDVAYAETLQAEGGTPLYSWSVDPLALPPGLTLNPSTGTISGTPTMTGAFPFTVTVTDFSSPARHASRVLCIRIEVAPSTNLTVVDLDHGRTPQQLAESLVGTGLTISNVVFTGNPLGGGSFDGGTSSVGFESGAVLSSGAVTSAEPGPVAGHPNTSDSTSTNLGVAGDADLNAVSGKTTFDASVLEFDFVPDCPSTPCQITFDYVFASEEYNEYVNTQYNDAFGFFVNGVNQALLQDTNIPVSINTINGGQPFGDANAQNASFYRNNDVSDGGGSINIEADGLTVVLHLVAPVNAGVTNHLKLAIADASDSAYNSWAFIKGNSFRVVEICNNGIDDDGDDLVDGADPDCHVCPSSSARRLDGLKQPVFMAGVCRADVEEPSSASPSRGVLMPGFWPRRPSVWQTGEIFKPVDLFAPAVTRSLPEAVIDDADQATWTGQGETAPSAIVVPSDSGPAGAGPAGLVDPEDALADGRVLLSGGPIRKPNLASDPRSRVGDEGIRRVCGAAQYKELLEVRARRHGGTDRLVRAREPVVRRRHVTQRRRVGDERVRALATPLHG